MSIKNAGKQPVLFLFDTIKGLDQSQIPFVQGFIVGATSNPFIFFLSIKTRFNKNDFPVRYFPTKLTIPICLFSERDINFFASSFIINFFVDESNVTKGIAV